MKKSVFSSVCIALGLSLGTLVVAWGASFEKGYTAFQAGDYATATKRVGTLGATG